MLSDADFGQYKGGVQDSEYLHYKAENGNIVNLFSFRCPFPTKIQRNDVVSVTGRIMKYLKELVPDDKSSSSPFCITSFRHPYRYYVYTLRRILL